jgi:quercetin dioxygenase-like cupin family protein
MEIRRASEGETTERTENAIFTGSRVFGRSVIDRSEHLSGAIVSFDAGARTVMHRHTSDQLLYIVSGIGKVGTAEGEYVVSSGDAVLIPAGENHWHGAGDTGSPMSHLTVMRADSQTTLLDE